MLLKEKVSIAREIAAVALEGIDYLTVVESLAEEGYDSEELADDIHDIITNALAAEIRGN